MTLIFDNQTPFEAIQFETLDQFDAGFHVFVAKVSYTIDRVEGGEGSLLTEMETPAPLAVEDEYWGQMHLSGVRHESDLAPYKPRCDILVNATAHAPGGKPTRRFDVRLRVRNSATPAALPEAPRGLNPLQDPSDKEVDHWQRAVAYARSHPIPGATLIDKTLTINGERLFRKKARLFRLFWWTLKWASLGLIRRNPWKLSAAKKLTELPLRYESAFGGQCRINADDKGAQKIPVKLRLSPEQLAQHPDENPPMVHTLCELNPLGQGFTEAWYLKATKQKRIPAPQIESPAAPINAKLFWHVLNGKLKKVKPQQLASFVPAGMGAIGRAWLPRRALIGEIEIKAQWAEDEVPNLPPEFDHGYWNAAPRDQQCAHLNGNEHFSLTNLCAADHPAATLDARRQTQLHFQLPGTLLYLALGDEDGRIGAKRLSIDTVIIDPEAGRVDVTWRAVISTLAQLGDAQLRSANNEEERQRLSALLDWQRKAPEEQTQAEPSTEALVEVSA